MGQEERKTIDLKDVSSDLHRFPYGAKLTVFLDGVRKFDFYEHVSLLLSKEHIVRFAKGNELHVLNELKNPEFQVWDIFVEGFPSACEAENAGKKLAIALLWSAISKSYPLRIIYHLPLPCTIYNRSYPSTYSGPMASGYSYYPESAESVVKGIEQVYCSSVEYNQKLMFSMDLFASARLEKSENARFIALITAIEALLEPVEYGGQVCELIAHFTEQVDSVENMDDLIKGSIKDRLKYLKQETITKSIRRLIRKTLPGNKRIENFMVEAYEVRSKLVHEGKSDENLGELILKVNEIMAKVYAALLCVCT